MRLILRNKRYLESMTAASSNIDTPTTVAIRDTRFTFLREHLRSSHFFPKRNAFRNGGGGGGRGATFSNRKMRVRTFSGSATSVQSTTLLDLFSK